MYIILTEVTSNIDIVKFDKFNVFFVCLALLRYKYMIGYKKTKFSSIIGFPIIYYFD